MVLWCAMAKTIGGGLGGPPPVVIRQNERPWLLGLNDFPARLLSNGVTIVVIADLEGK